MFFLLFVWFLSALGPSEWRSISIFDGQQILHGVTPIVKQFEDAHRFTVVYYALQAMWNCEPLCAELARIRNIKSKREAKRALDSYVLDQNGKLHGAQDD